MADTWKVGRPAFDACGFKSWSAAKAHLERHFLVRGEQWEDVYEGPTPGSFRHAQAKAAETHGLVSAGGNAIIEEARTFYEGAVRQVCEERRVLDQRDYLYQYKTQPPYEARGIIGKGGVLAGFCRGQVSDLRTALRPRPRHLKGRLTERQFVDAARNKLAELLASSDLLRNKNDE